MFSCNQLDHKLIMLLRLSLTPDSPFPSDCFNARLLPGLHQLLGTGFSLLQLSPELPTCPGILCSLRRTCYKFSFLSQAQLLRQDSREGWNLQIFYLTTSAPQNLSFRTISPPAVHFRNCMNTAGWRSAVFTLNKCVCPKGSVQGGT